MKNVRYPGPADHVKTLQTPEAWPAWPVLPVKRYGHVPVREAPECGVVLAVGGHTSTVFEANLFTLPRNLRELIDDPKIVRHVYDSAEAMVADGWVVD